MGILKNKKAATDTATWILIIIVALIAYQSGAFSTFGVGADGGVAPTQKVEVITDKACGSTTMTMDFSKKYSQSTSMTAQNGTVYINGMEKGVTSEGSTFTAQGGNGLNIYYALDPAQTTYYASHASGKIPCTGQTAAFLTSQAEYDGKPFMQKGSLAGALQDPPHEVYATDTALSVTILNADNVLNTFGGGSTDQAITTGQTRNLKVDLFATFEKGYGVADGNTLACQFNDTAWDQSQCEVSLNGKILPNAKYVPSTTRFPLTDTSRTTKMWALPAIDGAKTSELNLRFNVKADDTNQPSNGNGADWNCTVFDTDLYQTDSGNVAVDVEDRDDNSNIGTTSDFAFALGFS